MYRLTVKIIKTAQKLLHFFNYFCNFGVKTIDMLRRGIILGGLFILTVMMFLSCNKDMFNEDDYNELVERSQPVKGIDSLHTWDLTKTYNLEVGLPETVDGTERILILDNNPVENGSATLLAEHYVTGNGQKRIRFTAPAMLSRFFAALVDKEGGYLITSFAADEQTINFSQPLNPRTIVESSLLGLQTFTYCFEEEMPEPGDYDYNDVVMRMSIERTAQDKITINVTLAAVGSLNQIAAAMRLLNFKYDDIVSVTTSDGETFDDKYKKSTLPFIDSSDLLILGADSAAVINLFEDAHWATGAAYYASEGYIPRYKYNVSKTTSYETDMMSPRTISFIVTFKNPISLDNFTLASLDPFIILEYNGIFMENHAAYKNRNDVVLHEYVQPSSALILPWALIIPSGSFRYPLDNVNIGFANDEALFGAYLIEGHSFGQWAANHEQYLDWYNYPTGNMVY